MRILVIEDNDGGGFADYVDVEPWVAIFRRRTPGGRPSDYLIRVNRRRAALTSSQEGDRISFHSDEDRRSLTLPERRRAGRRSASRFFHLFPLERTRWRLHHEVDGAGRRGGTRSCVPRSPRMPTSCRSPRGSAANVFSD